MTNLLQYKILKVENDKESISKSNIYDYDESTTVHQFLIDVCDSSKVFIKGKYADEIEYVIKDERVYWGINISKCTLVDYLYTYPQEVVDMYLGDGIGCDAITLLEELFKIISWIMALDWIHEKIMKYRCYRFAKKLRKPNGDYIISYTFVSFILSRKEWKLSEFMRMLNCKDETLLRSLLYFYGYIAQDDDLFAFDKKTYENNLDEFNKFSMNDDNDI